ncbi:MULTISPECIES: YraN family protein [Flavobacteriaceae]|uniref:YraN family protein n=1 Tax=Flavobacteriaceae TaxID=49546 RepID=UPI001492C545|nr:MULTISPECIES: YraN family protein [Allomuricauda]MDC6366161.1 YraN family protein [Muricauda sp. AC10]
MGQHNEFGRLGEQLAVDFLIESGYKIHARNYRFQNAEIDVLAEKDNELCVVEVKSRNRGFFEDISMVISKKKIKLLTLAANQYVNDNNLDVEVRFDVITVVKNREKFKVEHLKNAFFYF